MSHDTLHFYNTTTKSKEPFTPTSSTINWYICGPTVYDSPHIGHARTYISFDVIRRVLESYFGFRVNYVMNITDVDDKIIKKAQDENIQCDLITKKYEKEFFDSMAVLNVRPTTFVTRVTEFIHVIEDFIENLVEKGMAYEIEDGIYFDINNYKNQFEYPVFVDQSAVVDENFNLENENLKKKNLCEQKINNEFSTTEQNNITACEIDKTIIDSDINKNNGVENNQLIQDINNMELGKGKEKNKRNLGDFCLWKRRDESFAYESRLGRGRPGWHIECSAMAGNIFPDGLDIHSGGIDLAFPHHENEVAQSQALLGKQWVKVFLHTGHLHIDGLKMSKSLKNFITIPEFIKKYTPRQVRMVFLINKWNMPMTYSTEFMEYAVNIDKKLFTFISVLESEIDCKYFINNVVFDQKDSEIFKLFLDCKNNVHSAFCDNIDTSEVIKILMNFVNIINHRIDKVSRGLKIVIHEYFIYLVSILGLKSEHTNVDVKDEQILKVLSDFRCDVRNVCKNGGSTNDFYKVTDILRDRLKDIGYIIEDKGKESRIRKNNK